MLPRGIQQDVVIGMVLLFFLGVAEYHNLDLFALPGNVPGIIFHLALMLRPQCPDVLSHIDLSFSSLENYAKPPASIRHMASAFAEYKSVHTSQSSPPPAHTSRNPLDIRAAELDQPNSF